MNTPIKAVIFGLGNQAFEHLDASVGHQDVQIIAGIDGNTDRHKEVCARFGELNLQCFQSLDELKASGLAFDALILALPHDVYGGIWADILALGKPLLKEKPLGRDYQEAKTFMDTAHNAHCELQTAIQRRQHASYQFLVKFLQKHKIKIQELHAHLHLGKGLQAAIDKPDLKWRGDRQKAGGGALLDVVYHLVHYIVGDFDVVSATMYNGMQVDNGIDIEDRSWLVGCKPDVWIMLDTWVKGEPNGRGGFTKSEAVELLTDKGLLKANREGVWQDGVQIFATQSKWQDAMRRQLTDFANNIRTQNWHTDVIWHELPAMRTIDKAYWLSKSY